MSDAADLRRKLDSARELQSVVRSMKALAAASVGQYERSLHALVDYTRTVELGLSLCLRERARAAASDDQAERTSPRAPAQGPVRIRRAVVFGSDQGLIGKFNEVIVEHALKELRAVPGTVRIWAVGERAGERLRDAGVTPAGRFAVPTSVTAIARVVGQILIETATDIAGSDQLDLQLFYNRPTSGASYESFGQRLLPLDDAWQHSVAALPWPGKSLPEVFGTDDSAVSGLIREHLFISLFRACTQSLASENASRLAAMQRAEKNIDELLEDLHSSSQRQRQTRIDEELFDVIAGFEALTPRA